MASGGGTSKYTPSRDVCPSRAGSSDGGCGENLGDNGGSGEEILGGVGEHFCSCEEEKMSCCFIAFGREFRMNVQLVRQ